MFGRLLLPSSVSALVLACSVAMPLPVASWRHCRRSGRRRVLRSGPSVSCILTVVGCCHGQPAHYEVCATVFTTKWTPQYRRPQTKTEIRLNIRRPLDMSRGHRICCRICTYNYLQYTGGTYRSRAHFPSQHELGPRTPPLGVLTTCSWHGRNTCVCCSAPLCALQISCKTGRLQKEGMQDGATAHL